MKDIKIISETNGTITQYSVVDYDTFETYGMFTNIEQAVNLRDELQNKINKGRIAGNE